MATSLEESKKLGPDRSYSNKYLSFGAKIAKICAVDAEIICMLLKKERKTLLKVKYIARSASLSGLNKCCINLRKFAKTCKISVKILCNKLLIMLC